MERIKKYTAFAQTLNDAYKLKYVRKTDNLHKGSLQSTIKVITNFSLDEDIEKIKIPLVCSGRLITAGEYFDSTAGESVILSEEELQKSLILWNMVPIMKSHAAADSVVKGYDVSIDHIAGEVRNSRWDPENKGINWEGIIADEDLARKIALGLIKFGSVTFARDIVRKEDDRLYYTNITPIDFSLVFNPKDKNASIRPGELK